MTLGESPIKNKNTGVRAMFKNVQEVKEFLLWAQKNNIKRVKLAEVEAEFSTLVPIQDEKLVELVDSITGTSSIEATQDNKEDEELLFWSANGS
jgi:hypothetical protein